MCIEAPESITNCPHCPSFGKRVERIFGVLLDLLTSIASSQASLGAHRSCFRVSSCVLSSNVGAREIRSWGSHCWMIPCDGPFFFFRNFYARHRCLENLTVEFDPHFPFSHRIDFLWGLSWDTQLHRTVSVNKRHRSFCATFLWLLQGCPTDSVGRKLHLSRSQTTVLRTFLWGKCTRSFAFNPEGLTPRGERNV